jgi:uncharacterized protein YjbI with pentapeptide repeats
LRDSPDRNLTFLVTNQNDEPIICSLDIITVTVKKWMVLICLVSTLHAADDKPWTWKDKDGVEHSRAELDSVISEHKKWLDTEGRDGNEADLSGAALGDAYLNGAHLRRAHLSRADLIGADLSKADLSDADLTDADLSGAYLTDALLGGAHLGGAHLGYAHLSGAYLIGADLSRADLSGADLGAAVLSGADLSRAELTGTDLKGANLTGTDFKGASYEPVKNPSPESITSAHNLAYMTWGARVARSTITWSPTSRVLAMEEDGMTKF